MDYEFCTLHSRHPATCKWLFSLINVALHSENVSSEDNSYTNMLEWNFLEAVLIWCQSTQRWLMSTMFLLPYGLFFLYCFFIVQKKRDVMQYCLKHIFLCTEQWSGKITPLKPAWCVLAVFVMTVHRRLGQNEGVTKSSMSLKWIGNLSAAGGSNSLNKAHNTQKKCDINHQQWGKSVISVITCWLLSLFYSAHLFNYNSTTYVFNSFFYFLGIKNLIQ